MPADRILELTLYALLRLLPFLALMLYVFWDKLRLPTLPSATAAVLLVLLRIGCGLYPLHDAGRVDQPNPGVLVYVAVCLLLIKAHFGKTLFTMIMLNNLSSLTVVFAKCLEGLLFPTQAAQLHRFTESICLAAVYAIVLPLLILYINRIYIRALEERIDSRAWRTLWLIPATFYFVWYRNSFFSAEGFQTLALRPRYALYCLLVNAGGMLVYSMVTHLINTHAENDRLHEREHLLELQQAQYTNLCDRIEEARRAKHDLRGHIHVMSAYLKEKRYDELEEYLGKYKASLPEDVTLRFCENFAVNAILQYFAGYAKFIGTGFAATVRLPAEVGIPDEVLTVVLGNLLENATEACVAQGSGSVISVRGKTDGSAVLFKIVNSCPKPPRTDRNGQLLSSKREQGHGIGLGSVRTIADQYDGLLRTEWEDGTFTVSVMLTLPEQAAPTEPSKE